MMTGREDKLFGDPQKSFSCQLSALGLRAIVGDIADVRHNITNGVALLPMDQQVWQQYWQLSDSDLLAGLRNFSFSYGPAGMAAILAAFAFTFGSTAGLQNFPSPMERRWPICTWSRRLVVFTCLHTFFSPAHLTSFT
jgi:hypothetical protein